MPSIHPDYGYDVFISYQQKDNQYAQSNYTLTLWAKQFLDGYEKTQKYIIDNLFNDQLAGLQTRYIGEKSRPIHRVIRAI